MRGIAHLVLVLPFLILFLGGASTLFVGFNDTNGPAVVIGGIMLLISLFVGTRWARHVLKDDVENRSQRRGGVSELEEIRLMQELHRGMTRMEERVESLETILLDRNSAREYDRLEN